MWGIKYQESMTKNKRAKKMKEREAKYEIRGSLEIKKKSQVKQEKEIIKLEIMVKNRQLKRRKKKRSKV